jgi:hypothetical protein
MSGLQNTNMNKVGELCMAYDGNTEDKDDAEDGKLAQHLPDFWGHLATPVSFAL